MQRFLLTLPFFFIILRKGDQCAKEVHQDVGQNLQQQSTAQTVPEEQNPDGDEQEDQGSLNIDGRIIGGIGFCLQRVWI